MYATLPGHLSSALIFVGAFVVALVLVTELARAARLIESGLRRSRFLQSFRSAPLTTVADKAGQSDSAPA
jgi:hypothetical protein